MKRTTFLESLRGLLPSLPRLAPAAGGMQLQFSAAGGGGGGGDDDYPDDDYYDDELPEDDEPAPRRERRPARRPTAARQRTVQTDPDDRYWTDYLRIALPVIGLLLVIAVFWYWAQQLIDDDSGELTPTEQPGLAEIIDTPAEPTEAPATPTQPAGNILQPQSGGTPTNPLQNIPSPTPTGEQPAAQEQPAETEVAAEAPAGAGGIAPDTQASVIEGPLNMRAEPNATSDIVVTLETGAVLDVLSGPEQGEDYVWWNVVDEQGNNGWVAEEFIQPAG